MMRQFTDVLLQWLEIKGDAEVALTPRPNIEKQAWIQLITYTHTQNPIRVILGCLALPTHEYTSCSLHMYSSRYLLYSTCTQQHYHQLRQVPLRTAFTPNISNQSNFLNCPIGIRSLYLHKVAIGTQLPPDTPHQINPAKRAATAATANHHNFGTVSAMPCRRRYNAKVENNNRNSQIHS